MSTPDPDPTPPSKAAAIAAALADRLATIRIANGYHTDAGQTVWRGRTALDPDDLPSITLFEQEDLVESQRVMDSTAPTSIDCNILLPFAIEGSAWCDPDHPNLVGHALIADIKRALFNADLTFGGTASHTRYIGRTIGPREGGDHIVTVTVQIQIGSTENIAAP
jgi:hypothetical protein